MENYEVVRDLGSGSFAMARLLRNRVTNELFAVKFLQRGRAINENVAKEIVNHRGLRHPNVIRFHEVAVTPTHLAVKMEYAAGGNLLELIQKNGRISEDEARYFFQQLISGISYCHSLQMCHRDLKLENILLDGSPAPRLKICDFGFSSSSLLHPPPRETVGTPTYIAPEVYSRRKYDGKMADVWSCGVVLYAMLVGAYPFENREDPDGSNNLIKRIMYAQYKIPDSAHISKGCREILSRIFVANPNSRISIREIRNHPWFLKNLPKELTETFQAMYFKRNAYLSLQSVEEIMKIVEEARIPPLVSPSTINVGRNETEDCTSNDNAKLAIDDLQEEFDEKLDSPTSISSLNSGEDNVGARATKLVLESKTMVSKISKLIFSGDSKDEVVGARPTEFVQGKATKENRLRLTFSSDGEDIVGTRATKLFQNEIAEERSLNSALPTNTRKMDMLGQRATKVSQSESRKVGLASLTISSSFSEKEHIVGARATKHTFSGDKRTSFTSEFD